MIQKACCSSCQCTVRLSEASRQDQWKQKVYSHENLSFLNLEAAPNLLEVLHLLCLMTNSDRLNVANLSKYLAPFQKKNFGSNLGSKERSSHQLNQELLQPVCCLQTTNSEHFACHQFELEWSHEIGCLKDQYTEWTIRFDNFLVRELLRRFIF